jgi:hypothetical protein
MQKILAKRYPFSILNFGLKRQKKKPKSSHPHHEKFDILDGINTPMKIFAFCISSFQSSWHFAFHEELNTASVVERVVGHIWFSSLSCGASGWPYLVLRALLALTDYITP